jgi:hypothetical protein
MSDKDGQVAIAGFAHPANNGVFKVIGVTATTVHTSNLSSVAEAAGQSVTFNDGVGRGVRFGSDLIINPQTVVMPTGNVNVPHEAQPGLYICTGTVHIPRFVSNGGPTFARLSFNIPDPVNPITPRDAFPLPPSVPPLPQPPTLTPPRRLFFFEDQIVEHRIAVSASLSDVKAAEGAFGWGVNWVEAFWLPVNELDPNDPNDIQPAPNMSRIHVRVQLETFSADDSGGTGINSLQYQAIFMVQHHHRG